MPFRKKVCKERQQPHVRDPQLLADLTLRIVKTATKHGARRIGKVIVIEREDIMIRRQIRDRTNARCAKKDFKGRAHQSPSVETTGWSSESSTPASTDSTTGTTSLGTSISSRSSARAISARVLARGSILPSSIAE